MENLKYQDEDNSQALKRQTNTALENTSQATQSTDESNETKTEEDPISDHSTENVVNESKHFENTSEDSSKPNTTGGQIKSNSKR